jgi:hypothetical protein
MITVSKPVIVGRSRTRGHTSPIPAPAARVSGKAAADLLTASGSAPDPRRGGARPHPAGYVLAVLVAAFSRAGFASLTGAAQWAAA